MIFFLFTTNDSFRPRQKDRRVVRTSTIGLFDATDWSAAVEQPETGIQSNGIVGSLTSFEFFFSSTSYLCIMFSYTGFSFPPLFLC